MNGHLSRISQKAETWCFQETRFLLSSSRPTTPPHGLISALDSQVPLPAFLTLKSGWTHRQAAKTWR